MIHESLPEYSIVLHLYIDEETKQVSRAAFSILKIIEEENHRIVVYPVHRLPEALLTAQTRTEITEVYNRITGRQEASAEIREEYSLNG